jgi:hypothetical protein
VRTKWQESFTRIEEKIQSAAVTSGRRKNCRTVKEAQKNPNNRGDSRDCNKSTIVICVSRPQSASFSPESELSGRGAAEA